MYRLSAGSWWHQYHRLGRQIEEAGGHPSATQIRRAALLMHTSSAIPALRSDPRVPDALYNIEWVIDYGRKAFHEELERRKAEADLGA